MPQSLFVVVLTDNKEQGVERLKRFYGDDADTRIYTELGSNVVMISDDTRVHRIADRAGITEGHSDLGISGAVFKLNGSMAGYASSEFWEWIDRVERRS